MNSRLFNLNEWFTSKSKRFNIIAGVVTALIVMGAFILLVSAFAKSTPNILSEHFTSQSAADTFENFGTGSWKVVDGTYQLSQPSAINEKTGGNANLSVNRKKFSASDWELNVDAKANNETGKSSDGTTPHDFSVVFDYLNETNYYFANFSEKPGQYANGIYKVENGITTSLASFSSPITSGQNYMIEVRKKGSDIKVYSNKGYLAKVAGKQLVDVRVGVGTRASSATFANLTVDGKGQVTTPDPAPSPEQPSDPNTGTPSPSPTPTPVPTPTPIPSGGRSVNVSNASQLATALTSAQPGDVINLADGTYDAKMLSPLKVSGSSVYAGLTVTQSGTAALPITIQGSRKAIVTGGGQGGHYGVHIYNAKYVHLKGFTVMDAKKGVVTDGANNITIDGLEVYSIGQEGIHLRASSSNNLVINNLVHDTGKKNATYGEGLYVGSANSNWGTYSGGNPDKSDNNKLVGNTVYRTGAESADIKEGTTGGTIQQNNFDGKDMTGSWADSWIDMKGNGWLITENIGTNAKEDGFQVHNALKGWGMNNTFSKNRANVNGPGYGFWLQDKTVGNRITCDNIVTGAQKGYAIVPCR